MSDKAATTPPPKHPYGRLATLRFAAIEVGQGLTTLLTLGEIRPRWVLNNAMTTAMRHARRHPHSGSSEESD